MLINNMQNDIIVSLVLRMTVVIPIGRAEVNLNISGPLDPIDGKVCIEEIGSRITVQVTNTMNNDSLSTGGRQLFGDHLVLPEVM